MIRLKRQFPFVSRSVVKAESLPPKQPEPLREFIYLDEVSLASLLASQKGEITENTTSQTGDESSAEIGGKITSDVPLMPSAEINTRFQTTNSSSIQTVRKANAQSLFRELHSLEHLRKIKPVEVSESARSMEELRSAKFHEAVYLGADLKRGDLVEFKVKLSASFIFQISTMVSEFAEMFDESPTLFVSRVNFADLYQAKNANKVISKLLAGLIPVDGVVSDYVVVVDGSEKMIAHRRAVSELSVEHLPLRVVGVTEHLAYWKDIRRVLFSDNEFTMLCRLSKSEIQSDWNPIKVADIFKEFAPDLSHEIENATKAAMTQSALSSQQEQVEPRQSLLALALLRYKDELLSNVRHKLSKKDLAHLVREISAVPIANRSASEQRSAFAKVKQTIEAVANVSIDSTVDLAARETVREDLDLPLFPSSDVTEEQSVPAITSEIEETDSNLLDVEVVAIYW